MVSVLETLMDTQFTQNVHKVVTQLETDLDLMCYEQTISLRISDDSAIYFSELSGTATIETVLLSLRMEEIQQLPPFLCLRIEDGYLKAEPFNEGIDILFCYTFSVSSNIKQNIEQFHTVLEEVTVSVEKMNNMLFGSSKDPEESHLEIDKLQKTIEDLFKRSEEDKDEEEPEDN